MKGEIMKKQNSIQAIVVFAVIAAAVFVAVDQTLPPDALQTGPLF